MPLEFFSNVLAPLAVLLRLPPLLAIVAISLIVSILVTLITKFSTNQKVLKAIRQEMKALQKQMKEFRHDAAKAGEINKRLMQKTTEQMRHSMRSFVFTLLPVILIFSWLQGHVAFYNLEPGDVFSTTVETAGNTPITLTARGAELLTDATSLPEDGRAVWELRAGPQDGVGQLEYAVGTEVYTRDIIVTSQWRYADPVLEKPKRFLGINYGDAVPIRQDSDIRRIVVNLAPVHPLGPVRLFGWQPGWLATYIIFMLLFTFPIRKVFDVH